jgi:hypothetical protein
MLPYTHGRAALLNLAENFTNYLTYEAVIGQGIKRHLTKKSNWLFIERQHGRYWAVRTGLTCWVPSMARREDSGDGVIRINLYTPAGFFPSTLAIGLSLRGTAAP